MSRNRGIKIILENPKNYMLLHNSKNSVGRPMTVNYQIQLDSVHCSVKRPFSSHMKTVENSSLQNKYMPTLNIREICENNTGNQKEIILNSKIPKKPINSITNGKKFVDASKKPFKKLTIKNEDLESFIETLKEPQKPSPIKNNLKSNNETQMLSKPLMDDVKSSNRLSTKNLHQTNKITNKGFLSRKPHKLSEIDESPDFKISEFSQINMDGSTYLMKEIDNIKAKILKSQETNSKISMLDAVKLINDIKMRIKSVHSKTVSDNQSKVLLTAKSKSSANSPVPYHSIKTKSIEKPISLKLVNRKSLNMRPTIYKYM